MAVDDKYIRLDTVFGGLGARETPPDEVAGIVDQTSPTTSPSTQNGWSPPAYDASEEITGQALLPAYDSDEHGQEKKTEEEEKEEEEKQIKEEAGRSTWVRKRPRRSSRSSLSSSSPPAWKGQSSAPQLLLQQQLDDASSKILRLEALTAEVDAKEALLRARLSEADSKLAELGEAIAQHQDKDEHKHESFTSEGLDTYIDGRMEELKEELKSYLDDRFEYLGVDMVMRAEMEEFVVETVEEQVTAAIEDLRERLAGGGVRVIITDE